MTRVMLCLSIPMPWGTMKHDIQKTVWGRQRSKESTRSNSLQLEPFRTAVLSETVVVKAYATGIIKATRSPPNTALKYMLSRAVVEWAEGCTEGDHHQSSFFLLHLSKKRWSEINIFWNWKVSGLKFHPFTGSSCLMIDIYILLVTRWMALDCLSASIRQKTYVVGAITVRNTYTHCWCKWAWYLYDFRSDKRSQVTNTDPQWTGPI